MIVSYSEGRVRLRLKELKNPIVSMAVKKYLLAIDGITGVEIKNLTGSILIEYNTAIISTMELFEKGKAELAKHGINIEIPKQEELTQEEQ